MYFPHMLAYVALNIAKLNTKKWNPKMYALKYFPNMSMHVRAYYLHFFYSTYFECKYEEKICKKKKKKYKI